jgi:hypothetical protein
MSVTGANGTWTGCDVSDVITLPNQEYCIPITDEAGFKEGNKVLEAVGVWVTVDVT